MSFAYAGYNFRKVFKMTILLKDIWPIENMNDYKIHFARRNKVGEEPLDVWLRNQDQWQGWQEYRPKRNDSNKTYIFACMRFYPEPQTWLFGGVYEVLERHADRYVVRLTEQGQDFIGRLKIHFLYTARIARTNMEKHYDKLEVTAILAKQAHWVIVG